MGFKADFLDAHERHWHDAEFLYQGQCWANADHLYGFAVECGLKGLMLVFGMKVDPSGKPKDKKDQEHARNIWQRFESYRCGHPRGTGYALPNVNPFNKWDVSDRYAHRSNFNQQWTQSHQAGAKLVSELIRKAKKEGLI